MRLIISKLKWDRFHQNILGWINKRHNNQLNRANRARERSISILQQRYGYSTEEATSQLDKHYSKAWLG